MILEQHKEQVTSNYNPDDVAQVTIESTPEAIKFLIAMLCNLYPKPKDTMMVEYVQNAVDSHDAAECPDRPIEITLPNALEPFFVVRDYGVGMPHEMVMGMYTKAMGSTKRDTNDQRGGYGVGKLVFAAYSGVMMLNTWDGKEKNIYTFRLKDGDGEIARNATVASTEERGVEIKIPINEEDIEYFNNRAQYLYSFLPTKPIIKNNSEIDLNPKASFQNEKFTLLDTFMDGTDKALATIGGLVFPIEPEEIYKTEQYRPYPTDKTEESIAKVLNNLPIVFHFNVGEIEHTPSRSSLMYSEKTIQAIRERIINDIKALAEERFEELINNVGSPWEARLVDYQINNKKSFSSKLFSYFKLNKRGIKYDGVEYSSMLPKHDYEEYDSHYKLEDGSTIDDPKWEVVKGKTHYKNFFSLRNCRIDQNDKLITETLDGMLLNDDVKYFYAPYDFSNRSLKMRIKHYINHNDVRDVKVVILREGETIDQFVDRLKIPEELFEAVEALPTPQKTYNSRAGRTYDRTSHDSKVLKWIGGGDQHADNWEEASLDLKNDKAVYVLIKYYKPWDSDEEDYSSYDVEGVLNLLKEYGEDIELYGVRTTEANKIGPNMIHLDDYIKSVLSDLKEEIGITSEIYRNTQWVDRFSHYYTRIASRSAEIDCDAIKHIAERYNKAKAKYDEVKGITKKVYLFNSLRDCVNGFNHIDIETRIEPHYKLDKMADVVSNRYPMINGCVNSSINDQTIEYINAINFYRTNKKK